MDVTAVDGVGGTSSHVRASQVVGSGASHAVASYGFEEPVGNTVVDESGSHDGDITGATRSGAGRFGRALSFDGQDDIVTVPDDSALRLTTGMTLEAWVKPTAATAWRSVIFKESNAGAAYGLYANSDRGPAGGVPRRRRRVSAARRSSRGIAGRTSRPRSTARPCACS